jgi:hypothetical protein
LTMSSVLGETHRERESCDAREVHTSKRVKSTDAGRSVFDLRRSNVKHSSGLVDAEPLKSDDDEPDVFNDADEGVRVTPEPELVRVALGEPAPVLADAVGVVVVVGVGVGVGVGVAGFGVSVASAGFGGARIGRLMAARAPVTAATGVPIKRASSKPSQTDPKQRAFESKQDGTLLMRLLVDNWYWWLGLGWLIPAAGCASAMESRNWISCSNSAMRF